MPARGPAPAQELRAPLTHRKQGRAGDTKLRAMRAWVRAHRWLGGLWAAALLFAQLAGTVYACEPLGGAAGQPAPSMSTTVAAEHEACASRRSAPGAGEALLCKAHCQADEQSVNSGPAASGVPPAALMAVALWPVLGVVAAAAEAVALPVAQALGLPAGAPPLFITLQVLRN